MPTLTPWCGVRLDKSASLLYFHYRLLITMAAGAEPGSDEDAALLHRGVDGSLLKHRGRAGKAEQRLYRSIAVDCGCAASGGVEKGERCSLTGQTPRRVLFVQTPHGRTRQQQLNTRRTYSSVSAHCSRTETDRSVV